jgi:hypothetical protein
MKGREIALEAETYQRQSRRKSDSWGERGSGRWSAGWYALILLIIFMRPIRGQAENGIAWVPNVEEQFSSLKDHLEGLGFHLMPGMNNLDWYNPSVSKHHQGIIRRPGRGTPYLYVTRNGNDEYAGNLYVVRMGSRDRNGERLRSNRMQKGVKMDDTVPDRADKVVKLILFDGRTSTVSGTEPGISIGFPAYGHPGGMAIVENVLFIPVEKPLRRINVNKYEIDKSKPPGLLVLADIEDPENPRFLKSIELSNHEAEWWQ